jgi:putative heme transporter
VSGGGSPRVKLLLSVLLAVAIFAFLFRRVDVAGARAEIAEMTWFELVTIAAIAGWNLVSYWVLWMAVTPGLTWTQAATLAQSGTAVTNTVPGGSGIGVGLAYAMLDSWGSRAPGARWPSWSLGCGTPSSSWPCPCSPWP